MKPKFIFPFLYFPFFCIAQEIKLIDSYSQSWSGGIAGKRGVNYNFVIEFLRIKKDVYPDTLWIGAQAIPILITEGIYTESVNTKKIKKNNCIRFEINAGTFYDEYEYRFTLPGDTARKLKPKPPVVYHGIALLSYTYKNKKRYYEISKIKRTGPPINYP